MKKHINAIHKAVGIQLLLIASAGFYCQAAEPDSPNFGTHQIVFEKAGISIIAGPEATVDKGNVNPNGSATGFDPVQLVLPSYGRIGAFVSTKPFLELRLFIQKGIERRKQDAVSNGQDYTVSEITPFKAKSGISGLTYFQERTAGQNRARNQMRVFCFYTEDCRYISVEVRATGQDKASASLDHPLNKLVLSGLLLKNKAISKSEIPGQESKLLSGIPVAGNPGFVTSPYSPGGYIDVREYPSHTEVKDPYTGKVFLTP
jgi:hypothetical protein